MGEAIERRAYLLAGPTASGKSAIAATLAREMGAWILSADSMLVYRGMDIGTAKPPPEEIAEWTYFLAVVNKSMTGEDVLVDNGEGVKSNFVWPVSERG